MSDPEDFEGNDILLAGILERHRHEPDDLPNAELAPDGHISFVGSFWHGQYEWHAIVDMSLRLGRTRVDALMTLEQAKILRQALDLAIRAATDSPDPEQADGQA